VKSSTVRLIAIAAALLASVWALVPTFQANSLADERSAIRERLNASRARWIQSKARPDSLKYAADSLALARWDSANGTDYRAQQKNFLAHPIKLGLDLQGGIYITMEVDVPALLAESAAREAVDETFEEVMEATRTQALASDDPVLDIFVRNFDKIARPRGKSLVNYFDLKLGDDATDEVIIEKLSRNIDDAVDQATEVIRQRIDKYGVAEPTIQKTGRRIIIELPGVDNEEEIRGLLQTTARLEFKMVYNNADAVRLFRKIDSVLAGRVNTDSLLNLGKRDTAAAGTLKDTSSTSAEQTRGDTTKKGGDTIADNTRVDTNRRNGDTSKPAGDSIAAKDTAGAKDTSTKSDNPYEGLPQEEQQRRYLADHPFSAYIFQTQYRQNADDEGQSLGPELFIADASKIPNGEFSFYIPYEGIERMNAYLNRPEVRAVIPDSLAIVFSAHAEFGGEPTNRQAGAFAVYVVGAEALLTGDYVSDAIANFDQSNGRPVVYMDMNAEGADRWADITGRNIKKRVAIVLDGSVYSAPTVQNKIAGGSSQISGSQDINEANLLAIVLKAGALKAPIKIIEERLVGPSLGEDSIRQGLNALLLAAALVVLFMAIYYAVGGIVADIAVVLNVLMTLAILAAFGATLTLPGIGGIVLTIGMAVDANILIYERIREELSYGKTLKNAVNIGFEKAFVAIFDSNVTTFMTGVILYAFGSGPIQGFAVTLMIGILVTLFTAVFMTRTFFMVLLDRGAASINFGQPRMQPAAQEA